MEVECVAVGTGGVLIRCALQEVVHCTDLWREGGGHEAMKYRRLRAVE